MWLIEKFIDMVWGVVRIVFLVLGSAIVFLFMVLVLTFLLKGIGHLIFDVDFIALLREWIGLKQ